MKLSVEEILELQHLFWMGRDGKKHINKQLKEFEAYIQEYKDEKRRDKTTGNRDFNPNDRPANLRHEEN